MCSSEKAVLACGKHKAAILQVWMNRCFVFFGCRCFFVVVGCLPQLVFINLLGLRTQRTLFAYLSLFELSFGPHCSYYFESDSD